jgi:tRNA(fMet)-specific endonuclease VapC
MTIADTDVLVDYLRGRGEAERIGLELRKRSFCTTVVTAFELWAGAQGPKQVAAVEALLAAIRVLGLDAPGARRAGEIRRELERRGIPIGMADSLIAGICLENDGILLTRNRKHFERVPGLRLDSQVGEDAS